MRKRFGDIALDGWEWMQRKAHMAPDSQRASRFGSFGDGTVVCFPPQVIYNEHAIHIGTDTAIGPWCSLTVGMAPGQELLSDRMLVIGDGCLIGRGTSIAAHFEIVIGDGVYFGPNVFVTDQNHANDRTDVPIGKQLQPERPVRIGAHSWLGTGVVVTPGVTIGERVMVGGNSVVTSDLPDDCVAAGAPARVLKS
jgi:acetyltransferase-like isoleucine patch superfamily enzyme